MVVQFFLNRSNYEASIFNSFIVIIIIIIIIIYYLIYFNAINPLALELDIYSLAHHLCKM